MTNEGRWPAGTTITLREIWNGKLWSARPMIVDQDRADLVVLWCPKGTRWKTAMTPPDRERAATRADRFVERLTRCDWVFGDFFWGVSNLLLMRPGDWHAVWAGWDDRWESIGWYVNIQRPLGRTAQALQTMDLMLDIVVEPDRTWRYKDEDELEALVAAGLIGRAEEARIWKEARRMVTKIEGNEPPFSEPWHEWRPDQTWSLPELPAGWDRL